jgi:hypothetical protein
MENIPEDPAPYYRPWRWDAIKPVVHPPLKVLEVKTNEIEVSPAGLRAAAFEGLFWPYGRLWAKILPDGGFAYLTIQEPLARTRTVLGTEWWNAICQWPGVVVCVKCRRVINDRNCREHPGQPSNPICANGCAWRACFEWEKSYRNCRLGFIPASARASILSSRV